MFDLLEDSILASTNLASTKSLIDSVSAPSDLQTTTLFPSFSSPANELSLSSALVEQSPPNLHTAQRFEASHEASHEVSHEVSGDVLSVASAAQRLLLEADQPGLSQAALNGASGTFTVGAQGLVEIDFLFDGGQYAGELAIFSLAGMGGLGKAAFEKEAIARALSGTENGQVVISDRVEGAQFSGRLGERDRNQGRTAATQKLTLTANAHFAFVLIPNNTFVAVANGETTNAPLFSISAFNPNERAQMAQASDGIFALEDMLVGKGDDDFNDLIFQVKGATSNLKNLSQLVAATRNWLTKPTAQPFLRNASSTLSPRPTAANATAGETEESGASSANGGSGSGGSDSGESSSEGAGSNASGSNASGSSESGSGGSGENSAGSSGSSGNNSSTTASVIADISDIVHKFSESSNKAQIVASGANSITIGSQTLYIGTNQVSSNNQNPIIRSFDAADLNKNWTRTDLETTGTDGRGLGLVWTGTALYGVFSVDGTQGQPEEDFRRATGEAQQSWLKSFGSGAGKIAVIAQLDPLTGALLKAAHLSAVKQDGKTNSLLVTGMSVNATGNLVISAKSYFSPRRPDGSAMTRDDQNTDASPFDYTVEMTPDLTSVVSTAAVGWR